MVSDGEVPHLVRAAASGEVSAWDSLVSRFVPLVWAVARGHGLAPGPAADVAQTTWLRLAESLETVPGEQLGAWLAAGTRAEALHALRWADPRLEVLRPATSPPDLRTALATLPARARLALRLLAVPGVTEAELAAALGTSPDEAGVLVSGSLARLADALGTAPSGAAS